MVLIAVGAWMLFMEVEAGEEEKARAVAAQLGLRLGARLSERSRELAEKAVGVALAVLGIYLLVSRLVG